MFLSLHRSALKYVKMIPFMWTRSVSVCFGPKKHNDPSLHWEANMVAFSLRIRHQSQWQPWELCHFFQDKPNSAGHPTQKISRRWRLIKKHWSQSTTEKTANKIKLNNPATAFSLEFHGSSVSSPSTQQHPPAVSILWKHTFLLRSLSTGHHLS